MPIFGDLGSKFSKTNVRFEIGTIEIAFIRNFANKIRKVIPFDPKCPNLGSKFSKNNARFEISTFEIKYKQNIVERLES